MTTPHRRGFSGQTEAAPVSFSGSSPSHVVRDLRILRFLRISSRSPAARRPVSNWNKGKKEEFAERKTFNLKGAKA